MRALALALALALASSSASANDCFHDEAGGEWRCSEEGFARLVDEGEAGADDAAFCRKERDAAREHVAQLEAAPPPPPPPSEFWPGFGWGAGAAAALFVLGLLFAR